MVQGQFMSGDLGDLWPFQIPSFVLKTLCLVLCNNQSLRCFGETYSFTSKSSLLKKYFLELPLFYCTALFYWIYNVCYLFIDL